MKAVVFDLGNVLLDFDHRIAANRIGQYSGLSAREIYDLFFDSDVTQLFEQGKISREDFFSEVKAALGLTIGFAEFLPIWNEIFFRSPKNLRVYALAEKLKAKYLTAVLSNINVLHYEYIKKTFPVFGAFHKVFASCDLGLTKPSVEIYKVVLSKLEAEPAETFYTDDRPELVDSAQKLGIKGFVFRSVEALEDDLAGVGISLN
jgi:FMN phosphatase YigB (HAD superfamily)